MKFAKNIRALMTALVVAGAVTVNPAQAAQTCEAGFRLLENELLATDPVCIPELPQRIVIYDFAAFDVAYSLNVKPVAYSKFLIDNWYTNFVPELMPTFNGFLADVPDAGGFAPNLEVILSAKPDLILINSLIVREGVYDQLSKIAPTVVKEETNGADWRDMIRLYGDALGESTRTEILLDVYESRLQAFRADSKNQFDGKTASHIQANAPGELYLNYPTYRGYKVLSDVGFVVGSTFADYISQNPDADNTPYLTMSEESVRYLDTEYIFMMNSTFDAESAEKIDALYAEYQSDPLWSQLTAVKNKKFFLVDLAWQANGVIAAHAVIDDMYRLLLETEPTIANPFQPSNVAITPTTEATAQATSETAGTTRDFTHEFGTTVVPVTAQRVIAADLGVFAPTFGTLAALEVKPIAATITRVPDYLAGFAEGVQIIPGQASYEALAAANPDLIITPGVTYNKDNYDQLAKIAPTVAPFWYWQTLDQVYGYWRAVAELVDKQSEGEQIVTNLDARIAALRTKLRSAMQGKTVSVFQVQGAGLGALYLQTGRLESALLNAVGIERPANQTYDPSNEQWYVQLSPELLRDVDAYAIFVEIYADDVNDIPAVRAELESNALWRSLDAVKNGRVYFVISDRWSGTDPYIANYILDAIDTNLSAALGLK